MRPELKQCITLTQADFERFPVWVGVHTFDYGEPWYDETDEETFRPWSGELPVSPSQGGPFLVRSQIILADGTKFVGFITPEIGIGEALDADLAMIQPNLFSTKGPLVAFWGGLFGFSAEAKKVAYGLLERTSDKVFPIRFSAESNLTEGKQSGVIRGFCKIADWKTHKIEVTV